ncbi:hypothetical protein BBP40_009322 [Aspergillus hancockii]|nr:hypothetical protein BBP40_009322 [Aspergillus hancockii]
MTSYAFGFAGGDAAVYMSEDVAFASRIIPRALMLGALVNGCLVFGMLIAVLYCVGSLEDANTSTRYPFMEVFYRATGRGVSSTLVFLARQGVSGWHWCSQVSSFQQLPGHSIVLSTVISVLLALIHIGSSVALDNVVSMAVSGLYLSYPVVSILLLYCRVMGHICQCIHSEEDVINVPGAELIGDRFIVLVSGLPLSIHPQLSISLSLSFSASGPLKCTQVSRV